MKSIDSLLKGNLEFSNACDKENMKKLSLAQSPKILWIGCSDSRVSPEIIAKMDLGRIFVHRNIANQVSDTDLNGLSVYEYAVNFLKVDSIIVCGHTGCGGIKAAIEGLPQTEYIGKWLANLENTATTQKKLNPKATNEELILKLQELNVLEQITHLKELSFIQKALKSKRKLNLYGCLFDIETGKLKVITIQGVSNDHELKNIC